jgi:hypothetical protein
MGRIFALDPPCGKDCIAQRFESRKKGNLRPLHIRPLNRQFETAKTQLTGEQQYLDIKSKSILFELGEDSLRYIPPECLEAALGIGQAGDSGKTECEIKHSPGQLARERLVDSNNALRMTTTANKHIGRFGMF